MRKSKSAKPKTRKPKRRKPKERELTADEWYELDKERLLGTPLTVELAREARLEDHSIGQAHAHAMSAQAGGESESKVARLEGEAVVGEEKSSGWHACWNLRLQAMMRRDHETHEAAAQRMEQHKLYEVGDLVQSEFFGGDPERFKAHCAKVRALVEERSGIDSDPSSEVNVEARKRADFHRKYPRAMQLRRFGQPRCKKCHRFIARCECPGPAAEALRVQERATLDELKARKNAIARHREQYGCDPPWATELGE